ncbi:unnamed protein product [Ambrosiozyma monospora]|uniref:Unnamed protein product n=1 Tax=Ambrosiozyma monospora TaxID=43982 RepID=A0A9W6SW40_AMBMO|nr:unnamed protein product [Ambrosiozyma monospora]
MNRLKLLTPFSIKTKELVTASFRLLNVKLEWVWYELSKNELFKMVLEHLSEELKAKKAIAAEDADANTASIDTDTKSNAVEADSKIDDVDVDAQIGDAKDPENSQDDTPSLHSTTTTRKSILSDDNEGTSTLNTDSGANTDVEVEDVRTEHLTATTSHQDIKSLKNGPHAVFISTDKSATEVEDGVQSGSTSDVNGEALLRDEDDSGDESGSDSDGSSLDEFVSAFDVTIY